MNNRARLNIMNRCQRDVPAYRIPWFPNSASLQSSDTHQILEGKQLESFSTAQEDHHHHQRYRPKKTRATNDQKRKRPRPRRATKKKLVEKNQIALETILETTSLSWSEPMSASIDNGEDDVDDDANATANSKVTSLARSRPPRMSRWDSFPPPSEELHTKKNSDDEEEIEATAVEQPGNALSPSTLLVKRHSRPTLPERQRSAECLLDNEDSG